MSYLNTRPLISGLEHEHSVELASRPPASVIDLLLPSPAAPGTPLVDLALVSLVDVLKANGRLTLVPASMIASDGPTHTVRLYARVPLEQVRTLHVDPESHTSVLLARLLLKERTGNDPALVSLPVDALRSADSSSAPEALLLIGDKVVTDPPASDAYPHQLDLGAAWHELTGLPFVYAVWACRTADIDPADPAHEPEAMQRVRRGALLLDRQRRHNATRLDWIVERTAVVHGWPADAARHYVGSLLRYGVNDRARAGVAEFVRRLEQMEPGTFTAPPWGDALLLGEQQFTASTQPAAKAR